MAVGAGGETVEPAFTFEVAESAAFDAPRGDVVPGERERFGGGGRRGGFFFGRDRSGGRLGQHCDGEGEGGEARKREAGAKGGGVDHGGEKEGRDGLRTFNGEWTRSKSRLGPAGD